MYRQSDLAILKQPEAETPVRGLCREHGISSAAFYKSKYGGTGASMVSRMKELEEQNRRLKKIYAETQMSADIMKEALSKNVCPAPCLQEASSEELARRSAKTYPSY